MICKSKKDFNQNIADCGMWIADCGLWIKSEIENPKSKILALRIADCGLRNGWKRLKSEIQNPNSEIVELRRLFNKYFITLTTIVLTC